MENLNRFPGSVAHTLAAHTVDVVRDYSFVQQDI